MPPAPAHRRGRGAAIVRRDTGEGYRGMLERLAQESGIETPTAEDLARRKRKGKKLSNQDWVSRSDPEAKIAKMKDGTTHLAYKRARGGSGHRRGGGGAAPGRRGRYDNASQDPGGGRGKEAMSEDPAVTRYHSRLVLKALAGWKTGSPSPSRRVLRAGTEMMRLAGRSPTTGPGCYRGWPGKPSSCAPRSSSAPLPTTSIAAVCAGPGFASRRRPQPIVADAPTHGAGTPKEAVAGGIGALFVLVTPAGAVLVVQIVLIVSEDGEIAAICFVA